MANRDHERPYRELGELLESWRSEKYRSALALFKDTEFPFSYSAYADFERGVTLPGIEALLQIADFFGEDRAEAALLWAKVQMPSDALQGLFENRRKRGRDTKPVEPIVSSPSLENTWVFGEPERKALIKNPWIGDIFALLLASYPNEARMDAFELPKGARIQAVLKRELKWAIELGYIVGTKTGLKLQKPYIHVPRTVEWEVVRGNNLKRVLEALLKSNSLSRRERLEGYHELLVRPMTLEQAHKWASELKRLESAIESEPYPGKNEKGAETYAFVLAFGRRHSG